MKEEMEPVRYVDVKDNYNMYQAKKDPLDSLAVVAGYLSVAVLALTIISIVSVLNA
jgi:hypothetical protein